jgi:hypothetical protein
MGPVACRYYTQAVGNIVYEMYKPDFEAFGYQREIFQEPTVQPEAAAVHSASAANTSNAATAAHAGTASAAA